jgi:hypothetical protein
MRYNKISTIKIFLLFVIGSITISCAKKAIENDYGDPTVFEKEIKVFESADIQIPPPINAIVCIGSSSIRGWHEIIHDDLAPLTIIARGFGGSNMNDALYNADRIILPYEPRAVIIYEGDNDIAQGISPNKIGDTYTELVNKIHSELPQCRMYFLSIKPSASRWNMWAKMVQTNKLISEKCTNDRRLIFVDVSTAMLNEDGEPRDEIFLSDELHMNRAGYEIWANILKPILLESELHYEQPKSY